MLSDVYQCIYIHYMSFYKICSSVICSCNTLLVILNKSFVRLLFAANPEHVLKIFLYPFMENPFYTVPSITSDGGTVTI